MATSTLIQSLNSGDAFPSNRRQTETFLTSATVAVGDLVCLDLSQTSNADKMLFVKPANSGAAATGLAVGVALKVYDNGDKVDVVISGFAVCKVAALTAAGANLDASAAAGVAGTVVHEGIAYAITAISGGTSNVFVKSRF
jgi:hypothetical protein